MKSLLNKISIAVFLAGATGGCVATTGASASGAPASPGSAPAASAPAASAPAASAPAASAPAASASGVHWVKYQAPKYGFSMLVPAGTKFAERQFGPNWGELYAKYGVVQLVALAKRNDQATPDEIERVGVKVTGIAAQYWKVIGQGKNQGGWVWWKTVTGTFNGVRVVGDYGVGAKSSYLMLLITTDRDFQKDRADYQTWYQSIRLN